MMTRDLFEKNVLQRLQAFLEWFKGKHGWEIRIAPEIPTKMMLGNPKRYQLSKSHAATLKSNQGGLGSRGYFASTGTSEIHRTVDTYYTRPRRHGTALE